MELNYLHEFVVLADVGNFLKAADELYISQSALSRHIKSMEVELGFSLFNRTTRKISLSEAGSIFYTYAQQISHINSLADKTLREYKRNCMRTVSVGSLPTMANYNVMELIFRFQETYPDIALNLIEKDTLDLIKMVETEELELAFIRSTTDEHPDFDYIVSQKDIIAAIIPASHPLAKKGKIELMDLAGENLALLDDDTFMYQFCVGECRKAGFEPQIGYTSKRCENILAMVGNGSGISLLTRAPILRFSSEALRVVPITPEIPTYISLIKKKDKKLGRGSSLFLNFIKQSQVSELS